MEPASDRCKIIYFPLVFETFLKCGKLQCKNYFNRKHVRLLNKIENFETMQIVLYLPGGYIMGLETTCHVHVMCLCHMSPFNLSRTGRFRDQQFSILVIFSMF